jgi:hypothetical protein
MTQSHTHTLLHGSLAIVVAVALGGLTVAAGPTLTVDPMAYAEACDGSAAISLSPDTFVVAHDDDNILRGYRVATAAPIFSESLVAFLGAKKEADIEGAARIGDVIYWIGSHGRDSKGNVEPTRLTLFATRVTTSGGEVRVVAEGKPYPHLLDTLIQPLLAKQGFPKASEQAPESAGGLNIEGLAATDTGLLIGFRNPLPGGKALVAELTNPAEVTKDPAAKAVLGRVFELDLGGRGIRSLELVSNEKGYLLVAGPTDDGKTFDAAKGMFAIYRWPSLAAAPQRVDGISFPKGFAPESLFLASGPTSSPATWAMLSDDGDSETDGVTCKKQPEAKRRFHRATLALD